MIDTLHIKIPIFVSKNFVPDIHIQKTDLETGVILSTVHHSDKYKIASHDIKLNIYKLTNSYIELEFSLPKLLLRTNTFSLTVNEQIRALEFLKKMLESFLTEKLEAEVKFFEIQDWLVNRVDFAHSYKFRSEKDMLDYLSYLNVFFISAFMRKHKGAKVYTNQGAYFPSRYFTFKVYAKLQEFLNHDFSNLKKALKDEEMLKKIVGISKGVLRFEVELRKDALFDNLKRFKGHFRCSPMNEARCEAYGYKNPDRIIELRHVLDPDFQKYAFQSYLEKFCLNFTLPNTLNDDQIREKLILHYGSDGITLFDFYLVLKKQGMRKFKKLYAQIRKGILERSELESQSMPSESAFYSRLKKLKLADISLYEVPKNDKYPDFDLFHFSNPEFPYSSDNANKEERALLFENARDTKTEDYLSAITVEPHYFNRKK